MKQIIALTLIIAINSCQQNTDTNDSNKTEVISISDTTSESISDSPAEPILDITYETIEQYAQIKNREELYTIFGEENIKNDVIWYAEGTVKMENSILTNPKDSNVINFVWNEGIESGELILAHVEIPYIIYNDNFDPIRKQIIYSENGLYTGMNINDLQIWNEAPFKFYGFDWDYGGMTMPEDNSNLGQSKVDVRLGVEWPKDESSIDDIIDSIVGDIELSSNDEAVKKATIFIEGMTYYIKD